MEQQNNFLQSLEKNSHHQENISENEWTQISQEKEKILSLVSDSKKEEFEAIYTKLDSFFEAEWEQIHKTTQSDLLEFKELFENSESKIESNDLQESLDYFWNSQELMELQKAMQEAGLDITQVLGSYQEFISDQLALPENSQISASEYSQLISNIRTLIVSELLELKSEIQDLKDDNNGEMTNMQWEINSILKDKLSNITDSLFPSAIFYINMSRKEISSQIINEQTKGTKGKLHAWMRLREIHSGLVSDNLKIWDDLPKGLIDNDSFFTLNSVDNERYDNFLMKNKIVWSGETMSSQVQWLKEITFLNEKDKQIEDEAMVACLALVWACCVPYAWAVPSVIFDIQDTFSSQDAMICFLKDHKIVPQEYHMDKAFYENILSAVGVIASLVGLQAAAKSTKLAKIMKKLNTSNVSAEKMSLIMNKVWDALWLKWDDSLQLTKLGERWGVLETKTVKVWNNIENIRDSYIHPKTDAEVLNKLLSWDSVRLYHSHSPREWVAKSMMDTGIQGSRGNEAFFSTMPPVEWNIVNNTVYTEVSAKKFFDLRGKDISEIPTQSELIDQWFDGTIWKSTSALANTNMEVVLFRGEELAGNLNKFEQNAKIPRIFQKYEDTFKMDNLAYGEQASFSIEQKSVLMSITRELLDYWKKIDSSHIENAEIELSQANISHDKIEKIIDLIKNQSTKLDISTEKVYQNASIVNNKDRLSMSSKLLWKKFSQVEENAIIDAHKVWGYGSEVFHYTQAERIEKWRILIKQGGFTRLEAELLLDSWLAGKVNRFDIKKDIEFPEGFFETFNISARGDLAHTLQMLPLKVSGSMDHAKMTQLLNFMETNPRAFSRGEKSWDDWKKVIAGKESLKYRIGIIDELHDSGKIQETFGMMKKERVDNIIQTYSDKKLFLDGLRQTKQDIISQKSGIVANNELSHIWISLWPDGGSPRNDFLFYASKNWSVWEDVVRNAIISRIDQIIKRTKELDTRSL